jgi:hypothetical protein
MTAIPRSLASGGHRLETLLVLLGAVGLALSGCGRDSGGDESTAGQVAQNVEATASGITVSPYGTGSGFNVSTASGLHFSYDLATGRWSLTSSSGTTVISQAYAAVNVDGPGYLTSYSYTTHSKSWQADVTDALGAGVQIFVDNTMSGRPTLRQQFTFYPGESFFTVQAIVWGTATLASNWMGPLVVGTASGEYVTPGGAATDRRLWDLPFDNDEWVRYDSRALAATADFSGTSYEATAVYDSGGQSGVVIGSITHDFWKTGLYYDVDHTNAVVKSLNVWGGVATADVAGAQPTYGKDGTHDNFGWSHTKMQGGTLTSPRVFVGAFADWRQGMERYGRANGEIKPPLAWPGSNPSPFGWMTWGAYGTNQNRMSLSNLTTVSNQLKTLQAAGFENNGTAYMFIDAGYDGDVPALVQMIHENGQKAGTYMTPCLTYSSDTTRTYTVDGTTYTFGQIMLKDPSGQPISHKSGSWVLDPTHPATRDMVTKGINALISAGWDEVKLDFLTDCSLEGPHYEANASGIQAYGEIMSLIDSVVAGSSTATSHPIFLYSSIAPLFPGGYTHSRRISCDVLGQLNDEMGASSPSYPHYGSTEYMLNGLTGGWWLSPYVFAFNDPDEMALNQWQLSGNRYPEAWAKTHAVAAAITGGTFLDASDYTNAASFDQSKAALTNPLVNKVAARGKSFIPVNGDLGYVSSTAADGWANPGSEASDGFYSPSSAAAPTASDPTYVAVFNFDQTSSATKTVSLSSVGLSATASYDAFDYTAGGTSLGARQGSVTVTVAAGSAVLLALYQ